ncbi:MAG: hypothetical protein AABW64_03835 [Nanoarchaeota archaeon]
MQNQTYKIFLFFLLAISISSCAQEFAKDSENLDKQKEDSLLGEDFPIIEDEQEYIEWKWKYYVCDDASSAERILYAVSCGTTVCSSKFYDAAGNLIEEDTGTSRGYEIKTKVANCKRTTRAYFKSKTGLTVEDQIEDCRESGRTWSAGVFTEPSSGECVDKLSDAGKSCKDSDECLGSCVAVFLENYRNFPRNIPLEERFKDEGVCSDTDTLACWALENGKAVFNCAAV